MGPHSQRCALYLPFSCVQDGVIDIDDSLYAIQMRDEEAMHGRRGSFMSEKGLQQMIVSIDDIQKREQEEREKQKLQHAHRTRSMHIVSTARHSMHSP